MLSATFRSNDCHTPTPTVGLDVMSLATSRCGHNRGNSGQRVAHTLAVHGAIQRELMERPQHRHPQQAQPVAHVRQRQGRGALLTPMDGTDHVPYRKQGQPWGRTREEKRPHRCTVSHLDMTVHERNRERGRQ